VYLVYSSESKEHFALKLFPFEGEEPHPSYRRECILSSLAHPNIIKIYDSCERKEHFNQEEGVASYTLMELAPYGTLFELIWRKGLPKNEILVRTYFHQLIDGVDYLHSRGIAHTDLKPENLLIGDQYILKIIDFERCKRGLAGKIPGRGTKNYRAPEVRLKQCNDPKAADVYSIGIVLFVMMFHFHPYLEDKLTKGYDLHKLLVEGQDAYWDAIYDCKGEDSKCSDEFKSLIAGMVKMLPEERLTIGEIKMHPWYQGPTYSKKELKSTMSKIIKEPTWQKTKM
jgi:serine/threonine protein kinase